jgi:hypothetical protein
MTIHFRLAYVCAVSLFVCGVGSSAVAQQKQILPIQVLDDNLGLSDFPGGEYRVPDSQVVISGLQNALLDFVLGTTSSSNNARGKGREQDVTQALQISASGQARAIIRELISTAELSDEFSEASSDAKRLLTIRTAIILTYVSDTDLQPFVLVKASLKGADTKSGKSNTRYFATSAEPLPLTGESSWTSDGGAALRAVVSSDLRRAIEFMLQDIASPAPRDEERLTAVEAQFPYMKNRYKMLGFLLREDASYIYYQPKIRSYLVMSGINILPKEFITYRPAAKGDPSMKEVPSKPPASR